MALVMCPECGKKVSSTSKVCVNCGYHLSSGEDIKKYLELAKLSLEGQAHDKVVEYADKVLEINPKSQEAWFLKAQSVGFGSSLNNMKYDQTVLAFEKAIEYASNKSKTADDLVLPCTLQIIALVDNAKDIIKLSLGMNGTDEIHLLMNYWIKILGNPSVSKEKLEETYPLFLKYSEMNSMRLAAITFANKVNYHETLQQIIQKRFPTFVFPVSKGNVKALSKSDSNYKENNQTKSAINPNVYFFVTILLGYLGVQHFLIGKNSKGLIYFFTFGLFGLGYIFDIFEFLLGKTKDNQGNSIKF